MRPHTLAKGTDTPIHMSPRLPLLTLSHRQDVKTLTLTPNPAPLAPASTSSSTERPQFVCPLTFKEMNGVQPFVYLAPCGCVFSQAALKTVADAASTPPQGEDSSKQLDVCPQCAVKYDKTEDVLLLNPAPDEEERMLANMERRRLSEPAKKSKKRKAGNGGADAADAEPPAKKKSAAAAAGMPSTNPSIAAASRGVVSSLALEEAKRKAGMSDAVKSLYSGDGPKRKETFMTMGTFTRVSASAMGHMGNEY